MNRMARLKKASRIDAVGGTNCNRLTKFDLITYMRQPTCQNLYGAKLSANLSGRLPRRKWHQGVLSEDGAEP